MRVTAGSRSFGGVSIQLTDRQGTPIPQAQVRFRLPEAGPSGKFPNGQLIEDQFTDGEGKAAAWGIEWGTREGICHVAVTAQSGALTAGTVARVRIVTKGTPQESAANAGGTVAEREAAPAVASFEVAVPRVPERPPEPEPVSTAEKSAPEKPEDVRPEQATERRPGVLLTRTERGEERISSGRLKWVLLSLGAAGAGGFAYFRLNQRPGAAAVAAPVTTGPVLTLSAPAITIGKP